MTSSTTTYLITGVNRGIGLALVKKLSSDSSNVVIGTVRNESTAKQIQSEIPNVKLIILDVSTKYHSFEAAFKKIDEFSPNGIDCLIANAGILGTGSLSKSQDYDVDQYLDLLNINVGGAAKTYKAAYPYLFKRDNGVTKRIIFISTLAASNGNFMVGGNAYGASKSAVNHLGIQISKDNQGDEINSLVKNSITLLLHPGIVDSDMSTDFKGVFPPEIFISTTTSADKLLKIIGDAKLEQTGGFFNENGEPIVY